MKGSVSILLKNMHLVLFSPAQYRFIVKAEYPNGFYWKFYLKINEQFGPVVHGVCTNSVIKTFGKHYWKYKAIQESNETIYLYIKAATLVPAQRILLNLHQLMKVSSIATPFTHPTYFWGSIRPAQQGLLL